MKPRPLLLVCLLCPTLAQAHLGSPDVFYNGMVGPWPTSITIRMPVVVPGRAEILVQVESKEPVAVTFMPLSSMTAVSNAPPAELAVPVRGETNLCSGQLWLMTSGAYSILVRIRGASGEGAVQIPVNSVATAQLPLPSLLGQTLLALGLILFCGGMAIVAAAAGESALPPGVLPGKTERRKYWVAAGITGLVLALALVGGRKWWNAEEKDFRTRLREGGWPDLAAQVRVEGSQRILSLTLGKGALAAHGPPARLELAPDHGKLLHLFVVGQPNSQTFAHLHPVRRGDTSFEVALPPLPEGDYELFCDLTFDSGFSSTATNSVHLPSVPGGAGAVSLEPDADDSWTINSAVAAGGNPGSDTICPLSGGTQIIWKAHPPLRCQQDAALQFEVRDPTGQPSALQPYMGMMSHAAVLRSDGRVFAHLHPSGNYSMAAQMLFDSKMAKESGDAGGLQPSILDRAKMDAWCGRPRDAGGASVISLPYEFPSPGDYRVWVQIKTDGQIKTAVFDTSVNRAAQPL
jgi:hypothetical protein